MTIPALHLASLALLLPGLAIHEPSGGNPAADISQPSEIHFARGARSFIGGEASAFFLKTVGGPVRVAPEMPPTETSLGANDAVAALRVLERARMPRLLNQVRIERRVIIRISPSPPIRSSSVLGLVPRREAPTTYTEIEHGDCVDIANIASVRAVQDNRLLLLMQNRQVLSAALERTCSARAFYSGFYVERSADGKLCVARDRLQSRSGASCQIGALSRLVAVRK